MAQPTTTPASSVTGPRSKEPVTEDAGGRLPAGEQHAEQSARWLAGALGVELPVALLELALTHRSFAYEHGGLPTNERLEFLGDSVLGLVVTDELYRSQPDLPEGQRRWST
jgi:ribonuclease-3